MLILTPSIEAEFYTKDDIDMHLNAGVSSLEASLRLRYEIVREFAPYIGVSWNKTYAESYQNDETNLLVGVKFWF